MTPECVEKEKTWARGFTRNIADGKLRLKSHTLRETEVTGDTARVSVGAVFLEEDGRENNEGMRFLLQQQAGQWSIAEIH